MDLNYRVLSDGLITYICFLVVLTFHEAAHAWMASRRGDDTARLMGRISLNPLVHMEVLGTVVLPLLAVFLGAAGSSASGFIIGWGKPVPFNPARLRNRLYDGMLIALAGPLANLVLAQAALLLCRVATGAGTAIPADLLAEVAVISLFLCYFNLLPIPPLDGSHVARYLFGWSEETFAKFCRFGIILLLVAIQLPPVRHLLGFLTHQTFSYMARVVGL